MRVADSFCSCKVAFRHQKCLVRKSLTPQRIRQKYSCRHLSIILKADDIVEANLRAAQISLPSGMVLNIATGRRISLNELVHLLNEIFGAQKEPIYEAERMGDIKHSRANTRLSKDLLGDYNVTALRDGLVKTVKWFSESSGRIKMCEKV